MRLKVSNTAEPRARGVENAGWTTAAGNGGLWSHCLIHFYVYKGGDTYVMVDTTDTNGQIVQFYWDLDTNGLNGPPTTEPSWTINGLLANQARVLRVYGKDDDSLSSPPLTFIIFPDEPPPVPTATYSDAQGKISWSGKDTKDGDATEYKIIVKKGSAPDEAADVVQDFQPGTAYDSGAPLNDFSYIYSPVGGTGKYYYQIIAKDARGSESASTVNNFDFIE